MPLPDQIIEKLLLSLVVGGLIGAEREYRSKSAGFRTLTLICLGSTLFTIFSQLIGANGNPDRIASNIATGIGFVGAGVIFKGDFGVNGITTAAMIWATAALGMGIGAGYESVSMLACALILVMLMVFSRLEGWIDRISQTRDYKIVCDYQEETLHVYEEQLKKHHLKFKRGRETKSNNLMTGEWIVRGSEKNHLAFVNSILRDPAVKTFEF
ncbi:MAG: MgtC/SapB family protein [Bacteroidota bacterium]|nr:MgtC/SapB family protein [Bacteroidota bacterium]MDP4214287.1 MgtC/SapB family protein [Bacteroidota bacterium]MDP4249511.1 MgtC/SapB family protein [Bacteroidota bacterium]